MILSFFVNYGIFSLFLVLTLLETGVALLALVNYEKYGSRIMKYIVPIWEVNGTFIAFYVVNLEVTYPKLMTLVGTIYIAPVMAALIIFMAHNSYLAYSEYIGRKKPERRFMKVYGVSMMLVTFIAVSVLTSSVSGISVGVSSNTIDLYRMFINGFNLAYFLGIVLITAGLTALFFRARTAFRYLPSALVMAGFAVIWAATYAYVPYIAANFATHFEFMILLVGLILSANFVALRDRIRTARILGLVVTYLAVMYYGALQYPYFFGKRIDSSALVNSGIMTHYANMVTTAGGILLLIGMVALAYYSYLRPERKKSDRTGM